MAHFWYSPAIFPPGQYAVVDVVLQNVVENRASLTCLAADVVLTTYDGGRLKPDFKYVYDGYIACFTNTNIYEKCLP